jgi:hypothetical protein
MAGISHQRVGQIVHEDGDDDDDVVRACSAA